MPTAIVRKKQESRESPYLTEKEVKEKERLISKSKSKLQRMLENKTIPCEMQPYYEANIIAFDDCSELDDLRVIKDKISYHKSRYDKVHEMDWETKGLISGYEFVYNHFHCQFRRERKKE